MAPALVGRGVKHFGIAGIHMYFIEACVVRDMEHPTPILATVGGLVNAAVSAWAPNRTIGSNPHNVRIRGVHGNHANVFGIFEAHVRP